MTSFGKRKLSYFSESPVRIRIYDDFFSPQVYQALCDRMQELIKKDGFTRFNFKGQTSSRPYDAFFAEVAAADDPLFNSIWNLPIYYFFLKAFNFPLMPHFSASFHYHLPGSDTGEVHSDFCVESFRQKRLNTGLYTNLNLCLSQPINRVEDLESEKIFIGARAIGLLYYLNNDDWKPEHGGETAFFASSESSSLIKKVEPINNRLLMFEVSPISFHAFQKNHFTPRCSFTSFLYTSPDNAEARFKQRPMPVHFEDYDVSDLGERLAQNLV